MNPRAYQKLSERWAMLRETFVPRFWAKVRVIEGGCWEWQGHRAPNGYGQTRYKKRQTSTHRVAFELTFGPIPKGMFVCHHCDNKPCCNPKHLFLGTPKDNTTDCIRKGRKATCPGEKNGMFGKRGTQCANHKLTDSEVLEIRRKYSTGAFTQVQLASEFGCTQLNISVIVRGKTWKHLLP